MTASEDELLRGPDGRFISGDCERDCQHRCAQPGRFTECDLGYQLERDAAVSTNKPGRQG